MANGVRAVWVYPLVSVVVWLVALMLFLYFFAAGRILLLGLLAAGIVAATLKPIADRVPGPRWVGALLAGLGFIVLTVGLVALLSWRLTGAVEQQIAQWPELREQLNGLLARWSGRFGLEQPVTVQTLVQEISGFVSGTTLQQVGTRAAGIVSAVGLGLAFAFVGSIYLLAEPAERLLRPVERLLPARRHAALRGAVADLEPRLRWWFLGTLASMLIVGAASWIGYTIAGVRFALPLALLAAAFEIVPTIGPLIAFAVAALVAATQSATQVVAELVVYAIVQLLESYVILPLIMERAVRIPPIVTLATVILWGNVFGPAGLLLALPLDLLVWTVLDRFVAGTERAADVRAATTVPRGRMAREA
ncbi:MAG: AI-2E family transporter [Candidatus Rokubacteria bacterium]|nr:AI-2E family transporter [Candidatus Rokubacteria bacterium]